MQMNFSHYNNGRKGLGFVRVPTMADRRSPWRKLWDWLWEPVL